MPAEGTCQEGHNQSPEVGFLQPSLVRSSQQSLLLFTLGAFLSFFKENKTKKARVGGSGLLFYTWEAEAKDHKNKANLDRPQSECEQSSVGGTVAGHLPSTPEALSGFDSLH